MTLEKLKPKLCVQAPGASPRRRGGGCGKDKHQEGARVLSYIDDFLVLMGSSVEALWKINVHPKALLGKALWEKRLLSGVTSCDTSTSSAWALELEVVYKMVQLFLRWWELTGKVVRLYCDNQAVVVIRSHSTLFVKPGAHAAPLAASGLKQRRAPGRVHQIEANEWTNRLLRNKDLDDWRLNWQ
ncbi:hypothetical protein CYMTET_12401 [Cymbomonas tetramitiformis]|uniref:Uncharacterized protein n=1 Tax=Cymbomonas tetramitiformis TaxID=36881 RepID=A0AAE0LC37_9CHLO|nr:hypothetical protein CYMTET_12401 [Cymbomonas tetramitiformis]